MDSTAPNADAATAAAQSTKQLRKSWGVLEPLHGPLGPVVDVLGPLASGPILIGILTAMVLMLWYRQPAHSAHLGFPGYATPARIAAYEEIWRREEAELWRWIEARVGMDQPNGVWEQIQARAAEKKLSTEGLGEIEIAEAIKVTRERLDTLEAAVKRQKDKKEQVIKSS